ALGEMVHLATGGTPRCRAAVVTEANVAPDGRHTALMVYSRTGMYAADASHDEDGSPDTWHYEH
ncbi:MAG TPA: hypothetical protein VIT65_11205, partial [Microlunatus sp.]